MTTQCVSPAVSVSEQTFLNYAASGFMDSILPIIPPGAKLSPTSNLPPENIGKVPGRKTPSGWVGLGDWVNHRSTQSDLSRFAAWGAGLGLNCHNLVAFDIDVLDDALAAALERAVLEYAEAYGMGLFPAPPVRFGNPDVAKRLLLARTTTPTPKRRLAFRLPGESPDEKPKHAVELLGHGQQFIAEGLHKSGKPYHWRDDISPASLTSDGLVPLAPGDIEELWAAIGSVVDMFGGEVSSSSGGSASTLERVPVIDGALRAPSPDAAVRALKSIPCESISDYEGFYQLVASFKASVGGDEEFYPDLEEWALGWPDNDPDTVREKWDSFRETSLGWGYLSKTADEHGYCSAQDDFEPVETGPGGSGGAGEDAADGSAIDMLVRRYAYFEFDERFIDLETGAMLTDGMLNKRHSNIGSFASKANSASGQYHRLPAAVRNYVQRITYRPGQGPMLTEDGERAVNLWRPGPLRAAVGVSDADIKPWLDLAEYLVPDQMERDTIMDWMACVLGGSKPNWAVVLGSDAFGVGKGLLIRPLQNALGQRNYQTVPAKSLESRFNTWAWCSQLTVFEEIHSFERKGIYDMLKQHITAPPDYVEIERKGRDPIQHPNVTSFIFLTNHRDALALEDGDRRYFVSWIEKPSHPDGKDYYKPLADWIDANSHLVAGWLRQRDLSRFNAQGAAPVTAAKLEMTEEAASSIKSWADSCIRNGAAPFDTDLIVMSDVAAQCPDWARGKTTTAKSISMTVSHVLRKHGAKKMGEFKLGREHPRSGQRQGVLWAVRRVEMLKQAADDGRVVDLYWSMWEKAKAKALDDGDGGAGGKGASNGRVIDASDEFD
ncbi:protein of unknown function [Magnetospirillum sp. XM-1]|uniref:DUF5906 domain-containing protein n=1 Tax=Magnetospirillum sp. XM-1 TaxID=1663591 RepID=UPI00073DEA8C|nr:DUF5906 domain-containing protein [Magnetospirillum sp. XM-1]CUW38811.1 protein of unknown function [Magnetospirillum sp. XM-1]